MEHISTFPLPPVTLVLGGARSGKSTHAEKLATGSLNGSAPQPAVYVATAQAGDVEMATRIAAHRTRRGSNWSTIEEPLKLDEALASASAHGRPVLVDCLTLWLSNVMLGGARSGKSTHAEKLATGSLFGGAPRPAVYIATAEAGDVEMATRIMAHRARRGGAWTTIEEPVKLAEALQTAATHGQPVLVDCLTLWLSNLMHAEADLDEATDELVMALDGYAAPVVFVSNEVGLGLVPETPLGRAFRDAQGRLNMRMAERADRVILMAAGLPLVMKDRPIRA